MTRHGKSAPAEQFIRKYADDPDPWNYETSPYELEKYQATLAALPCKRYMSALEIGCSIGVFTSMLAPRCDRLLAVDFAEPALEHARQRCAQMPQVRFELLDVPRQFPQGSFDLIVLAEVGYYWSRPDLKLARDKCIEQLRPGGQVMLVHWTATIGDAPLDGDTVHSTFAASSDRLDHLLGQHHRLYRLDLFERRSGTDLP